MLPEPTQYEPLIDHVIEECTTSLDHLTNAVQDLLCAGRYFDAAKLTWLVEGVRDVRDTVRA